MNDVIYTRHTGSGKGDQRRPDVITRAEYEKNYERTFGSDPMKTYLHVTEKETPADKPN